MNRKTLSSLAQLEQTQSLSESQLSSLNGGFGYSLHTGGLKDKLTSGEPITFSFLVLYPYPPSPTGDITAPTLTIGRSNDDISLDSHWYQ